MEFIQYNCYNIVSDHLQMSLFLPQYPYLQNLATPLQIKVYTDVHDTCNCYEIGSLLKISIL